MAANPLASFAPSSVAAEQRLLPFAAQHAAQIASWVTSDLEAYWLAPRTPLPITEQTVRSWAAPGRQSFMLVEDAAFAPVGYGEINVLNARRGEYWLGHLIIDPAQRGRGLGLLLTEHLIDWARWRLAARRVTLVVFPENAAAIRVYRRAGMTNDGYEEHYFPARQRFERLVRLAQRL